MHVTLGSGQRGGSTAAQGAHAFGSGQFTTGHLGLGQGGQSPILHGLLQVLIHGGHAGTEDFNTYRDISGGVGHSDFNIYRDMSGWGGHGGTEAFRMYLLQSIAGHIRRSSPEPRHPQGFLLH